jgi:hypothetical protein
MNSPWKLVHRDTGAVVVESLEIADTYWRRLVGLQFRRELLAGCGLLLVPCSSVHTFWMRFAVDVVAIDRSGKVVAVRERVRPWRIVAGVKDAHAILEVTAETANVQVGDHLKVQTNCEWSSVNRPLLGFFG